MSIKVKKYQLSFEHMYDFDMVGISSHHNDYRLAWGLNNSLGLHLAQSDEKYVVVAQKKGESVRQEFPLFEYYEEENQVNYYLIKNKEQGKFLIPERPMIDYFLFIHKGGVIDLDELSRKMRDVASIMAVFPCDPEEMPSTTNIVF